MVVVFLCLSFSCLGRIFDVMLFERVGDEMFSCLRPFPFCLSSSRFLSWAVKPSLLVKTLLVMMYSRTSVIEYFIPSFFLSLLVELKLLFFCPLWLYTLPSIVDHSLFHDVFEELYISFVPANARLQCSG